MNSAPLNRPSACLRVALLGVGGYGGVHLQHLHTLQAEGRVRLVAVADPFLEEPALLETRTALLAAGVQLYTDYRDLCARETALGLVVIVAPIPLHEAMVIAALATGARIYLEKPPVPTVAQWSRLIATDTQHRVAVGFQMLSMTHLQTLRVWIESGALGKVRAISFGALWPRGTGYYQRADWAGRLALNGEPVFDGPATNALSHIVNNVMFLAGAAEDVRCAVPTHVSGEFYRARPDIESYDLASLSGEFASGITFAGTLGHCSAEGLPYEIRVQGEKAVARLFEDGVSLEAGTGLPASRNPQAGEDAVARHYRETVAWAAGERPDPVCSLHDTEGYLRTVNTGLVSSGRIHSISPGQITRHGDGADFIAGVHGLPEAIRRVLAEACPLSATGLAWTVPGQRRATTDFPYDSSLLKNG